MNSHHRDRIASLCVDGRFVGTIRVLSSLRRKARDLIGFDGTRGTLLLPSAHLTHTLGTRAPVDVAYLDCELTVLAVTTMRPWRIGRPRPHTRQILKARAGTWDAWTLRPGSVLAVSALPRPDDAVQPARQCSLTRLLGCKRCKC